MCGSLVTFGFTLFSPDFAAGSHKRSHSLGEKEIGRSPPSPAPEQPFRDRSNTLSEKPSLPVIRDKYKDLTGEVEVGRACQTLCCCVLTQQTSAQCSGHFLFFVLIRGDVCVAAGERALRVRVAEVSGKCSGGLYVFVSFV